MPNWCVGVLKVRGKRQNLIKFVTEGLQPVGYLGDINGTLQLNEYDSVYYDKSCWIVGTRRGFVNRVSVEFDDMEEDETRTIGFEAEFAWAIDEEQLLSIAKKHNVDIKIYGFERGMEFNQNIEIIDGKIVRDETIRFSDYDWECINPLIGG